MPVDGLVLRIGKQAGRGLDVDQRIGDVRLADALRRVHVHSAVLAGLVTGE